MSDEPEPQDEDEGGAFAFFRNDGSAQTEEAREGWRTVRDTAFPIPIVQGTRLPVWSVGTQLCSGECHVRIMLIDDANDEAYAVQDLPVFVAHMSGAIIDGEPNPMICRVETMRRIASLN